MSLVIISVDREKIPAHTDEQFEDWIKYEVWQISHIRTDNPLCDIDITATVREID